MIDPDLIPLRLAIEQSRQAAAAGHQPYGAVLCNRDGHVLAVAHNTQGNPLDVTGHAEMNLVRHVASTLGPQVLKGAYAYASGEPCPMCASALYWAGVDRIVFGASMQTMAQLCGPASVLAPGCADLLRNAARTVEVRGPILENEAASVIAEGGRPDRRA
jgi:tRNA(Arg) A34 adenosine deaminase TadA